MARPAVVDGSDPQAVADLRVLIDCLQELVRGAYTPVRNCAKYPETVWLADVPERLIRRTADAGSAIMVVRHRPPEEAPRVPAVLSDWVPADAIAAAAVEPPALAGVTAQGPKPEGPTTALDGVLEQPAEGVPAEVRAAYAAWARRWVRWSQQEREAGPERQLHQRLYRMAKMIQQDGDSVEAVLAIGLVQLVAERASARVCRHIVTVPVLLSIDRQTVDVTVSLAPGVPGRLEDMEFLSSSDGFTAELLSAVRSAVEDAPFHPLSERAVKALRVWSQRAFGVERTVAFNAGWEHPDLTAQAPARSLHHAPALILREHGQRSVLGFYEAIARALKRPTATAPLGDLFYIENWSPTLDLYVLLKTFGAVVGRQGAY